MKCALPHWVQACRTSLPVTSLRRFWLNWKLGNGDKFLFDLGTGSTDRLAGLEADYSKLEKVFIITLVQYFHSYDTHDGGPKVRKTGPRLIYIRKISQIGGWLKADYKGEIDCEDDEDYSSILELQFGKMFTPRIGAYVEGFIGDDVLSTDAYNKGVGIGLRFMY